MILRVFILFFSLFFTMHDNWMLEKVIKINATNFTTDQSKNIYVINGKQLRKYDVKGNFLKEYSSAFSSDITFVDASNPLKILIFYKDFNQIIFLDNMLSEIGSPIMLDDLNLGNIQVVCSSENGGFRVFSEQYQQLFYFDNNLNVEQRSMNISLAEGNNNLPDFLIEKSNILYLCYKNEGIFMFDGFGALLRKIPIQGIENIQIENGNIIYSKNNILLRYNINLIKTDTIFINTDSVDCNFRIEQNVLFAGSKNAINVFRLNS